MTDMPKEIKRSTVTGIKVANIAATGIREWQGQRCGVSSQIAAEMGFEPDEELLISSCQGRKTPLIGVVFSSSQKIVGIDRTAMKNLGVNIGEKISLTKTRISEVRTANKVDLIVVSIKDREGGYIEAAEIDLFIEETKEMIKRELIDLPFSSGNHFVATVRTGHNEFLVTVVIQGGAGTFFIREGTGINLMKAREDLGISVTWEDIGGLDSEIEQIREAVELPYKYPQLFDRMRLNPPKGIILTGPPGSGKTLLGRALASILGFNMIVINGGSIASRFFGASEELLRSRFEEAKKNAPCIIFIDEIDAMAPFRGDGSSNTETRVVSTLLTEMDGIRGVEDVTVIGATNRVEAIDPALRRPGRFDLEIEIGVPNEEGRKEILEIHLRDTPAEEELEAWVSEAAKITKGCVGADLAGIVRKAKLTAIRRLVPDIDADIEITGEDLDGLLLRGEELKKCAEQVDPSALRQFLVEVPEVPWTDIGGLDEELAQIQESIVLPLHKPEKFAEMGVKSPSGLLLFGPPGCGKTLIAQAVATEGGVNFLSVKGPELLSKWVGESEKAVRLIFSKAKQVAPCVIFFDEAEAIGRSRGLYSPSSGVSENMLSQLLTEMEGVEKNEGVIVIMATNRPDILDPALIRKGRLDKHIYIKGPDQDARKKIFEIHAGKMKLFKLGEERGDPSDAVDFERLATSTEGFTGSDIESVCNEAGIMAIREDDTCIRMRHFEASLEGFSGSLTDEMKAFYDELAGKIRSRKINTEALDHYR